MSEQPSSPVTQHISWETDPGNGLIRFLTDERYSRIHPRFKKHYRPYRCSECRNVRS